jgi:hypothetical protein
VSPRADVAERRQDCIRIVAEFNQLDTFGILSAELEIRGFGTDWWGPYPMKKVAERARSTTAKER